MPGDNVINPMLKKLLPDNEKQMPRFRTKPALESVYQSIFQRDLERYGIEDDFYPIGSAANYSLLYLVLRICKEIKPRSVLDIGAGQTSMLWSRLAGSGAPKVLTVEHDPEWSRVVQTRIEQPILLSPLREARAGEHRVLTYDWDEIRAHGPFDVIVCDGPHGTTRWSRLGVINMLDETLPEDFVLVMDDAERAGERESVAALRARLETMGRKIRIGKVRGQKAQAVIAGGAYWPAAYF